MFFLYLQDSSRISFPLSSCTLDVRSGFHRRGRFLSYLWQYPTRTECISAGVLVESLASPRALQMHLANAIIQRHYSHERTLNSMVTPESVSKDMRLFIEEYCSFPPCVATESKKISQDRFFERLETVTSLWENTTSLCLASPNPFDLLSCTKPSSHAKPLCHHTTEHDGPKHSLLREFLTRAPFNGRMPG